MDVKSGERKKRSQERFEVGGIGLEPTTFAMSTQRSNQLSYPPIFVARIIPFEPFRKASGSLLSSLDK